MFESLVVSEELDALGFLTAAVEQLAKLPSELWRTGNEGFAGIAAALDQLAVQVDCARVGLVAEAEARGVVDQSSSPSSAAWLMEHSFHLEPSDASRITKLPTCAPCPRTRSWPQPSQVARSPCARR